MFFTSTRADLDVTAAQAIARGISREGGLFVPSEFPRFSNEKIQSLVSANYKERAKAILSGFLTAFTADEIDYCVNGA